MTTEDKSEKVFLPRLTPNRSAKESNQQSPFYIPEDSEIFRMREKEKEKKKQQRLKLNTMKIWEKGIKQKEGITMKDLKEMTKSSQQQQNSSKTSLIEAAKSAIKNRVKSNQPMHEFIQKKRQMLLFQMLIDHKREQITEFQQLTRLHRKGLERAEYMLEQDMQAFNTHLNDNKRQARDAIKKAQNQTRQKNQKGSVIKQKQEIKTDLAGKNASKLQALQNLKKYKDFLDSLKPETNNTNKNKKEKKISELHKKLLSNPILTVTISPQILEFLQEDEEEEQMYFKDPAQLVNIFLNLEESNLFLMTNSKIIQQSIEVVKNNIAQKKKILDAKKSELVNSKAELTKQINMVEKEIELLKINTNKDDFELLFLFLEAEIIKLSKQYGDKNAYDQKLLGLQLLKDMQKKLEIQVNTINQFRAQKQDLIIALEKNCFNDKRQKKRKMNEDQLKQIAQKQKFQQVPKRQKRMGRPIMAKSKLKVEQKEEKVEDEGPKQEEIERRKYLT